MNKILMSLVLVILGFGNFATASDDHAHEDEHKHEEEHEHGTQVEVKEEGFSLTPEAIKNFELRTTKLVGTSPWLIAQSAVLYAGEEVNVYRVRKNLYTRIDFKIISQQNGNLKIHSADLQESDEVVINGVGFVRIVEIVSSGGMPHGHSH